MGDVAIYTEMGRFMMAPYGCLVTKAIHEKHIYKEYIGVDACAANLMRPAIYGSYHHITVLGKEDAPCDHTYDVVGSLCYFNIIKAVKGCKVVCRSFCSSDEFCLSIAFEQYLC